MPYDSGNRGARMGGGPERLLSGGLEGALRSGGREVRKTVVEPEGALLPEVATAFELMRLISGEARRAVESGELPLVLSGNCNASVGTIAGVGGGEKLGIVWFDAHADFNTPETTTTGFTDGMGLAVAVGHCWGAMAGSVPGFSPVPEQNVVLVGTRATEPAEHERLEGSGVAVVGADLLGERGVANALGAVLDALGSRASRVYSTSTWTSWTPERSGRSTSSRFRAA